MRILLQAKTKEGKELLKALDGKTAEESKMVLISDKPTIIEITNPDLEKQKVPNIIKRKLIENGIRNLMYHKEGIHMSHYKIELK